MNSKSCLYRNLNTSQKIPFSLWATSALPLHQKHNRKRANQPVYPGQQLWLDMKSHIIKLGILLQLGPKKMTHCVKCIIKQSAAICKQTVVYWQVSWCVPGPIHWLCGSPSQHVNNWDFPGDYHQHLTVNTWGERVWRWRWRGSRGPSSHCSKATSCSLSGQIPKPPPCNAHVDVPPHPVLLTEN